MRLASIESEPWEISASTSIGAITCLPFIDKSTKAITLCEIYLLLSAAITAIGFDSFSYISFTAVAPSP